MAGRGAGHQPHFEYPQERQVSQPSIRTRVGEEQRGQKRAGAPSAATATARRSSSTSGPALGVKKPMAKRCLLDHLTDRGQQGRHITPFHHWPPRGSNTALSSSTTNETSPPRRNTGVIMRVSATVQANGSMFFELMNTSNGRLRPSCEDVVQGDVQGVVGVEPADLVGGPSKFSGRSNGWVM